MSRFPTGFGAPPAGVTNLGETINITSPSQLPDPSGGVITLAADTVYHFHNTVVPAAPLVGSGGTVLKGESRGTSKITIASASPLLGDGFSEVSCLTLENTASGPCMDTTLGPATVFRLRDCIVINGARDTITTGGPFSAVVLSEVQYQGGFSGVELVGPFAVVGLRGVGTASLTADPGSPGLDGGRLIKLSGSGGNAVAAAVEIVSCPAFQSNANQTGLWVDPAPPAEGGVISLCAFGKPPVGIGLAGVTPGTPGWRTSGNPGIRDSTTNGTASFSGNTLATTFADTTTWKTIAHTPAFVAGSANEQVTLVDAATTGKLRIDARIESKLRIAAGVVVEGASGTNYIFEFRFQRVRDSVITTMGTFRADYRNTPVSKKWEIQVDAGASDGSIFDEYYLEWRNITSAIDGVALDANFIVERV